MDSRLIRYPTDTRWITDPICDYYVTFWTQPQVAGAVDDDAIGSRSEMYEVFTAADVVEVIEWAENGARERSAMYTIFARLEHGELPGLVWIAGIDPTSARGNFDTARPSGSTPMVGGTEPYRPPRN
jgi:hypothetical protein